ncbi:MAG: RNA methyltransferase [Pseudomonadota bacterium]
MNDHSSMPGGQAPVKPVIILVAPQMGENIGACARAMLNSGIADLRLVAPRDGWPNPAATAMAAGADAVLENAQVFATTREALADLTRVYATTARPRDMVKPVVTPRQAARESHEAAGQGGRVGYLFGPEADGLDNADVSLADAIITVPCNPDFSSFNIAQAVLLVAYEWFQEQSEQPARQLRDAGDDSNPPRRESLDAFFDRLIASLDERGYFRSPDLRERLVVSLRNLITRMEPNDQDIQTLHGVMVSLMRVPNRSGEHSGRPD